jgi:APA family basic amino acid/polyamine antiporter
MLPHTFDHHAIAGFDTVATAAEETKNPEVALPVGIVGSLAICTVIYMLMCVVLTGE